MTDIPIQCACGAFKAKLNNVGPKHGNRVICYCESCQEFQRYLGKDEEVLDKHGGTDIYQVSPGRLEVQQGKENLACVHLTEKPTLRWYTDCCKTPIGNTLATSKLPFIGLISVCMEAKENEQGLDGLVGPVRGQVNSEGARGDISESDIRKSSTASLYLRFFKLIIGTKLRGEHKNNPLFDAETGRPIVKPQRLDPPFQP